MPGERRTLFSEPEASPYALPSDYTPQPPPGFEVARIVLAKGSLDTAARRSFVERICAVYPSASVIECPDLPHNRIELGEKSPVAQHREGVRTLVFGELKSAVRQSEESGNACPNYWHFSVYGYCFYGCSYCYLAGTPGVWHSPTVKIYVNLPEIVEQIDRTAHRLGRPMAFYLGKLQDGLALDPLSAYSTVLVPFFAQHPFARQVLLTKSASVERLLGLNHGGHTTLSWSLNAPGIATRFETNVPTVETRMQAMQAAAAVGYPVRAIIMPVIPVPDWEEQYGSFLHDLLTRVPLRRLTFGGICSYVNSRRLMEEKLGKENVISRHFTKAGEDGRTRYAPELRVKMYSRFMQVVRARRPDLEVALCLESQEVWREVNDVVRLGRCNCGV